MGNNRALVTLRHHFSLQQCRYNHCPATLAVLLLTLNLEFRFKNNFWEELIAYFPWYDTGHIENDASKMSSIVACVLYRGNDFTEPLPSNYRGIFTEPLPSNDRGIFTEPLPSNDKGGYTDSKVIS
jgi:hypothetical protein